MATSTEEEPKDVTSNEEKELRRVYDYLANYYPKSKLMKQMEPKLERKHKIMQFKKNPEAVKLVDENGAELTNDQIDAELARIEEECEILQEEIDAYNSQAAKKVSAADLQEALKHLGKKATKKEIEDMIWEVDENLDGCVDWEEFHLMFQRNIKDRTGLEPFQLFNVVQFMMYDRDNSGSVTVDETMHMLYARYGKDRLEAEMKALFGDNLNDGGGSLTFNDYLKAVNVRIPKGPTNPKAAKKSGKGKRG